MPRRDQLFETITTEGALLPSDFLQRLAQRDRNIAGLTADASPCFGGPGLPLRRCQPRFNRVGQRKQDAVSVFGL